MSSEVWHYGLGSSVGTFTSLLLGIDPDSAGGICDVLSACADI